MTRTLTWTKLTLAALAVAASASTAFAGEGNGPSFPGNDVPDVILDHGKDSCGILTQGLLTRVLGLADGRRQADRTAAARAAC